MTRVNSVDALRAFALMGIAVVNMPFLAGHFGVLPDKIVADSVAAFTIAWLFAGKFFLLFAFLFGWGVAVQQASAARQGIDFAPRFMRRQLGLLAIGVAHALLVFVGDILVTYALIGLALFAVRTAPNRRLLQLAGVGVAAGAVSLAIVAIAVSEAATLPLPPAPGYLGSFGQAVHARFADIGYALPFILLFNGPLVFAAFCAGMVAARTEFLAPGNTVFARLCRHRFWLLGAGLLANLPFAAVATGWTTSPLPALASVMSLAIAAPLLSLAYLLIVARWAAVRDTRWLTAAGRISLSGYVLEGVIGGLIFNGYGLGWFGQLGTAAVTAIAVGVFLAVEILCSVWSRFVGTGPLEQLLRRLTYGRPGAAVKGVG